MEKKYLNESQILELKKNLMPSKKNKKNKRSKSTSKPDNLSDSEEFTSEYGSSSLSNEFYKMYNKEKEINFETNIRQTFEIFYGCKKISMKQKILYRKLIFEGKIEYITDIKDKKIKVKDQTVIFHLNPNKSLDISSGREKKTINDEKPCKYELLEKRIIINKPMELELDGIYENFDLEKLNKEEIECIYQSIDNSKISSFKKVVLEIKFNGNEITELLHQLERDREFLELVGKDEYLFVGVINSKSVNKEKVIEFMKNYENLNFIILGIKNSVFANKDVTKYHDWDEINKVMNLEKKIVLLEKEIEDIKKLLRVNSDLLPDIKKLLVKKRKRGKRFSYKKNKY